MTQPNLPQHVPVTISRKDHVNLSYHIERIHRRITISGLAPNMDGLHESLKFPCPIEVWKWALASYFDADEISQGLEFGWGVSITKQPRHKDVKWNLQGTSLFQSDVQHYIYKELQFGALMGLFELSSLPFDVFCNPLNTVPKKNSDVRRTVVDCTQLDLGIISFIFLIFTEVKLGSCHY